MAASGPMCTVSYTMTFQLPAAATATDYNNMLNYFTNNSAANGWTITSQSSATKKIVVTMSKSYQLYGAGLAP